MTGVSAKTRRSFSQRAKRLVTHPIRTLREANQNRRNRAWNLYYTAALMTGQSERNAREFADQISGKAFIRDPFIAKNVGSFLRPLARSIKRRQAIKAKILMLVSEHNALALRMRKPHLSREKRNAIEADCDQLVMKMNMLYDSLPRANEEIKKNLGKMTIK